MAVVALIQREELNCGLLLSFLIPFSPLLLIPSQFFRCLPDTITLVFLIFKIDEKYT